MNFTSIDLTELATRESDIVEWKENVADERKIVETVVAFANDFLNLGGGYIVCGARENIDENGWKVVQYNGLFPSNLERIKKYISDTCYNPQKVNPPIIPKFDEIFVPSDTSKRVLVITVDATGYAHAYKADNDIKLRYFIRTDSNTRGTTTSLERELLRRKGQLEPWDKRINQFASISDIDELILRQYLQNMKLWSANKSINVYLSDREKIEEFIPPLLGKMGIDKSAHPKNFSLMVFGKSPIDFCAGAYSIFTVFEGNDRSNQHGETQWITGTVVEQANKLIELLNIESTIAIDKGSENSNQIKYPKIALKEAVVNAVVHRDYEIDQPVRVEIYNNRIEIYSPGGLPFNGNKEKFIKGEQRSSWRNQAFGRIFTRLNLAQHQGSGIGRIISSMQEEGCPAPIFDVDENSVTCVLPAHPRHQIMKQLSEAESDIVIKDYVSAYKKLTDVLSKDMYNYRALELFCEVNTLLSTPEKLYDFLSEREFDFSQVRATTIVAISETLSSIKNNVNANSLAKTLLDAALTGKLEERQLVRVAITLKKLGKDKEVVEFVDNSFRRYPNMSNNPYLLDQKGRALIDLAKRCQDTFFESSNPKFKSKAREDFEKYIVQAEKVLHFAHEYSENGIDRDYISKALNYIHKEMRPFLDGKYKTSVNLNTIYVSDIPNIASYSELDKVFSSYGKVLKITIKEGTHSQRKFAYIHFENAESVDRLLIDRNSIFVNSEKLYIARYRKNSNRPKK